MRWGVAGAVVYCWASGLAYAGSDPPPDGPPGGPPPDGSQASVADVCSTAKTVEECAAALLARDDFRAALEESSALEKASEVSVDQLSAAVAAALGSGTELSRLGASMDSVAERVAKALRRGDQVAAMVEPQGCTAVPRTLLETHADMFTLCFDATAGVQLVGAPTKTTYVHPLPSQRIRVLVRQRPTDRVSVSWEGSPGATAAGLDGAPAPAQSASGSGGASRAAALDIEFDRAEQAVADAAAKSEVRQLREWVRGAVVSDVAAEKLMVGLQDLATDPLALSTLKSQVVDLPRAEPSWQTYLLPTFTPGPLKVRVEAAPAEFDRLLAASDRLPGAWRLDRAATGAEGKADPAAVQAAEALRKSVSAYLAAVRKLTSADAAWADRAAGEVELLVRELAAATGTTAAQLNDFTARVDDLAAQVAAQAPVRTEEPLTVDTVYSGGVRPGVAVHMFGAADADYGLTDHDGQSVIDAAGVSNVDLELVLGYTHFYSRVPSTSHRPRLGLTFATGIADLTDAELTVLRSAFIGPELGWKGISFALGPSVRQVTRLRDGYSPGAAVTAGKTGDDLTTNRWGFGLSFVVYAPEIVKLRNGDSSK